MLGKMPGDEWQRFANLRLLYTYMFTYPGAKLLFMGGELGQHREWCDAGEIDWQLLESAPHSGLQQLVMGLDDLIKDGQSLAELNGTLQNSVDQLNRMQNLDQSLQSVLDSYTKIQPTLDRLSRPIPVRLSLTNMEFPDGASEDATISGDAGATLPG